MSIALQILLNDGEIDGKKTVYVANRDIRCEYVPRKKVMFMRFEKLSYWIS